MRKVIMWNMVTIDGFFEGPKSWDIDWHEYAWGDELERLSIEQSKSVGMLLFGRVTYQGMATYWSSATGEIADFMNSIPKVVFLRTLERAEWNNTRLVSAGGGAFSRSSLIPHCSGLTRTSVRYYLETHHGNWSPRTSRNARPTRRHF